MATAPHGRARGRIRRRLVVPNARLSEEQAVQMRHLSLTRGQPVKDRAARFGVWHATVCAIGTGHRWSWRREWTGIRWAAIVVETGAA
jgi:hypothetical protein